MTRPYRLWKTRVGRNDPTYKSWWHMVQRCENPQHANYRNYGARGIKVCARWQNSFDAFVEDMGFRTKEFSIERLNHNGNYEPENCVWLLKTEQTKNSRQNRFFTFAGRTQSHADWAREFGISRGLFSYRLSRGKYGYDL